MEFKNGDVVRLRSGGPDMTIKGENLLNGKVLCQWFVGATLKQEYFLIETLEKIEDNPNRIFFDMARRILKYQGKYVFLTPHEALIINLFICKPNTAITHEEIVSLVSKVNQIENPADITRPLISRLKEKVKSIPGGDEWIQSVRGTGYLFVKENIQELTRR
jgi:uncharacterized protein YodC (DUF2158 family)